MPYFQAILSDLLIQAAISLVALGVALAIFKLPKNPVSRKHAIWLLWVIGFGILAVWTMRQQSLVFGGGLVPSPDQPISVAIKGTVRYVSQELAYRHSASIWPIILCGLAFAAAYKFARVENEA